MSEKVKLYVSNTVTYISDRLPSDVYQGLRKLIGYRPETAVFKIKYSNKHWDGIESTLHFNEKSCKCSIKKRGTHFPTGLFNKARDFLVSNNIELDIYDIRDQVKKNIDLTISDAFETRDYQSKVIDDAANMERGIIKCATGGGKTPIAAGMIQSLGVAPFIFYVPSIDLLQQARSEFSKFLLENGSPLEVGIIGNGQFDIKDINVMTVQTAVRALGGKYVKFDEEDKDKLSKKEVELVESKRKDILDLIQSSKGFIADEVQHWASETCQIIADNSLNARYRYGFSVGPNSKVEVKQGLFNEGKITDIENVWNIFRPVSPYCWDGNYEILQIPKYNLLSRGWNGKEFCWKRVNKIIRHKCSKKAYRVYYRGKNNLLLTEDHSVFIIRNGNILCVETKDLKIDDILIADNGKNWGEGAINFDIYEILKNNYHNTSKIRVKVDLSQINHKDIGFNKQRFYQILRRGSGLPLDTYLRYKNKLPKAQRIYTEGAKGVGIHPDLNIRDLYYMIGFYLGDGWFDGNRINFAVEDGFVKAFISNIKNIKNIFININTRDMDGGSKEIRISNALLSCILKHILGNNKCNKKNIPHSFIFSLSRNDKLELIRGMLDSDGCLKEDSRNRKEYRYTTTSKNLSASLSALLRSLGVPNSLSVRKAAIGGKIKHRVIQGRHESYQIIFSKNALFHINKGRLGNCKRYKDIDCNEYKILSIEETNFEEYVYDFEMDGHPSFVAEGILVHNSATPWRDKGDDILIDACFGRQICNITASFLIEHPNKYLVRPDIWLLPFDLGMPKDELFSYHEYYKAAVVENIERNKYISNIAKTFEEKNKIVLILCQHVTHGKIIEELIDGSVFLHGSHSSKQRKEHLQKMREGKAGITIATSIFDEGIDCRPLDTLILAGGGKSQTRALQRVGRVLRPYTSPSGVVKEYATVVDIQDNCKYLSSHGKKRKKIYQTETAFNIKNIKA